MPTIAIDMTPMLPGGHSGGAKVIILHLIREFSRRQDGNNYILLTNNDTHAELGHLDNHQVQRYCVGLKDRPARGKLHDLIPAPLQNAGLFFLYIINKKLPSIARHLLRYIFITRNRSHLLEQLCVDLLFCPFSTPYYQNQKIPMLTIIHDLLHVDYPWFLKRDERWKRDLIYRRAVNDSDTLICDSEFTRRRIQSEYDINHRAVVKIQPFIHGRFPDIDASQNKKMLKQMGIENIDFGFYPANYWPHKNHEMLLVAFQLFLKSQPDCPLNLVFTGSRTPRETYLRKAARHMGLEERVHFLGFRSDDEMSAIMNGCKFLIFPSLYEGFGMPVLEAMQYGKPVLCSNTTSLPEVVGNAGLYFDPRKPTEIAHKIEQICTSDSTLEQLKKKSRARLTYFESFDYSKAYMDTIQAMLV